MDDRKPKKARIAVAIDENGTRLKAREHCDVLNGESYSAERTRVRRTRSPTGHRLAAPEKTSNLGNERVKCTPRSSNRTALDPKVNATKTNV